MTDRGRTLKLVVVSVAEVSPPTRQLASSWSQLAATACLLGAVVAVIALVWMPWISVGGPNVYRAEADVPDSAPGPIFLLSHDVGRSHGLASWVGVIVSAVAGLVALAPERRLAFAARGLALVAAAFSLLAIFLEVVVPTIGPSGLGPGVHIQLQFGFWLAVAGLVTIGIGAIRGPRRFAYPDRTTTS